MAVQPIVEQADAAERRKIAQELGIDENNLDLTPSKNDLRILPSPA